MPLLIDCDTNKYIFERMESKYMSSDHCADSEPISRVVDQCGFYQKENQVIHYVIDLASDSDVEIYDYYIKIDGKAFTLRAKKTADSRNSFVEYDVELYNEYGTLSVQARETSGSFCDRVKGARNEPELNEFFSHAISMTIQYPIKVETPFVSGIGAYLL